MLRKLLIASKLKLGHTISSPPANSSLTGHIFPTNGGDPRVPLHANLFQCPYCVRSLQSKIGLRQHKRHMHPIEYNNEVLQQIPKRKLWSQDEVLYLAIEEFNLPPGTINVNQALHKRFPHRSLDAIQCRRKMVTYQQALEELCHESSIVSSTPAVQTTD